VKNDSQEDDAEARLHDAIKITSGFIDGIEQILMVAEKSLIPHVQAALPTLGHLWLHLIGLRALLRPDERGRARASALEQHRS
jgi:hypothetical protein